MNGLVITGFSFSGGFYFSRLMENKIKNSIKKRTFDSECLKTLQQKLNKGEALTWEVGPQYTFSGKREQLFFDHTHLTFA